MEGENKLNKNNLVGLLFGFTLLGSVTTAQAALIGGPVWPAPGGTSYSSTGDMGFVGGQTRTYSAFDFSAFDQLWWGLGSVGSAMDGSINSAGESMSLVSTIGNTATWTGTTTIATTTGTFSVDTRLTATISSGGSNWLNSAGLGIDSSVTNTVSEITSDPFVVNLLYDARFTGGSGYTAFKAFYDNQSTIGNNVVLSNSGNMHYTPAVPVPAAVWLFGSGLLGLIGIARRKKA